MDRRTLERRIDAWLKTGGTTRQACGHLIFTWNAFRIDCDPRSVLGIVDAVDPRAPDLGNGASYRDGDATAAARLIRSATRPDGITLTATMILNPEAIRRRLARTDVGVGELMRRPVTPEAARRAHMADDVTGTITVTFDLDAGGAVRRRIRVARYTISSAAKGVETNVVTETLERKRIRSAARPTPAPGTTW